MKDSSEILTSRGFASNCDSHILFLLFGLHDFFCCGVNFLFIKSLCRFCVSQPLEEILNEVSDLLCSSGKVELKDQISPDWEMQKRAFLERFFLYPLLFEGGAVHSDQDATSRSQSEVLPSLLVSDSHSAEPFPWVRFEPPRDGDGRMTRQGHSCALISVSVHPPVNCWVDSCALHP